MGSKIGYIWLFSLLFVIEIVLFALFYVCTLLNWPTAIIMTPLIIIFLAIIIHELFIRQSAGVKFFHQLILLLFSIGINLVLFKIFQVLPWAWFLILIPLFLAFGLMFFAFLHKMFTM